MIGGAGHRRQRPDRSAGDGAPRCFRREQSGAAAVEFAIVGFVLIVMMLAVLEFGRMAYIYSDMSFATEVASRRALIDPAITDAALAAVVRDEFSAGDPDDLQVAVTAETIDGRDFRKLALDYNVRVVLPGFPGGGFALAHDRRVPVPP